MSLELENEVWAEGHLEVTRIQMELGQKLFWERSVETEDRLGERPRTPQQI